MKKSAISEYSKGSAEQVIAHAAWQHSRGRNPSMPFLGESNPIKALALATSVIERVELGKMVAEIGAIITRKKSYYEMDDVEIKAAVRHIISSSSSEAEVEKRLRDEIDYPYDIAMYTTIPDDATGREARELVRGLGGLVMKNGAMVMAMMHGHDGTIHL